LRSTSELLGLSNARQKEVRREGDRRVALPFISPLQNAVFREESERSLLVRLPVRLRPRFAV
jgi:hypothetical protein